MYFLSSLIPLGVMEYIFGLGSFAPGMNSMAQSVRQWEGRLLHSSSPNTPIRSWYSLGTWGMPGSSLDMAVALSLCLLTFSHWTAPFMAASGGGRGPTPNLHFLSPTSHQMVGPHLSSHARPRITASVIFGTIIKWMSSQCQPISNCKGSVISVAGVPPINDPSTCSNHRVRSTFSS